MEIRLPKVVTKNRNKRVGRGIGSGKGGHTVGRGQKGQKVRGKIGVIFEGLKVKKSLLKKLPLGRGKGRFKASDKPIVIKVVLLNLFKDGATVDLSSLAKEGIVKLADAQEVGVKVLGDGELTKKLTILLPVSKSAAEKIEKAGGKVENSKE